jgi:acetyl esterase/lipase
MLRAEGKEMMNDETRFPRPSGAAQDEDARSGFRVSGGNRPRPSSSCSSSIRNRFAPRTRTSTRDEDDRNLSATRLGFRARMTNKEFANRGVNYALFRDAVNIGIAALFAGLAPLVHAGQIPAPQAAPSGWRLSESGAAKAAATPATITDVPYGDHVRQTMDIWQARSGKPTPLVFYIHGGGWVAQDKTDIHDHLDVRAFLDAGISVASINYRLLQDANAAHVAPPVEWPLNDAKRALQFVRSKAGEWNLDKTRIAATGVSAGGGSSLWLGLHDEMAEPGSPDPVARESTRLFCVAAKAPVVSLDPRQVREWIPNAIFGAHAFGFANLSRADSFAPFLAARDSFLADIQRYSPIEQARKGDPPVFVEFPMQDKPPVPGEPQTDPSHSAISGLMLERKLQSLGVPVELRYRGDGKTGDANVQEFLTRLLTGAEEKSK